jgi:hypothetical protein
MSVIVSWESGSVPERKVRRQGKVLQFLMKDGAPMVAVLVLGDKPTITVRDLTTVRFDREVE